MKRFVSLLAVFVMAFMLVVPASATDYNGHELPTIPYDKDFPFVAICQVYDDFNSAFGTNYEYIVVATDCEYRLKPYDDPNNTTFTNSSTSTESSYMLWGLEPSNSWIVFKSGEYPASGGLFGVVPVFANYDVTNRSGDEIYLTGTDFFCDGSDCYYMDKNFDDVCDTCGLPLKNLVRQPVAPVVEGNNLHYVMMETYDGYTYTAYTLDTTYSIQGQIYGTRLRTNTDPAVNVVTFNSYDGFTWEQTYTGKSASNYPGEVGYTLLASTFDWYNENGERFFPVPLWEEVLTVTQGEMSNLTQETDGMMRVLVLCGVGLMALLVVLKLFGKRSLLFLR